MMGTARYSVSYGLSGCYMPDDVSGPYVFHSRGDLAAFIRGEIDRLEWPASRFAEVRIRDLWGFIKRRGSSCAHFSIEHEGCSLSFHGLTQEEAEAMEAENDW